MPSAFKLAVSLIFIILSLFLTSTPTFAANAADFSWSAKDQSTWTLGNLVESINTGISGTCAKPNSTIEVFDQDKQERGMISCDNSRVKGSGGAIGYTTGVMTALYNPPTSSVYYLANLGENLGLGPKTAYAQVPGSGAGIIEPVMALWQVMRNIAYVIFIVIFLVVGFMIMFKQKINPQTVIGVQQALPSLVIGLILVTFSYFIAALIVDFAFVGIQLVTQIFTAPGLNNSLGDADKIRGHAQNANIFWLFMSSAFNFENVKIAWQGTSGQLYSNLGGPTTSFVAAAVVTIISSAFIGPFSLLAGGATAAAIPIIIPGIVVLVLLVALFIQMFKLLFALLSAYITILVMTFAGPFFILAGSIPGRGGAISNWFKSLIANTLIFPAVFAAFLFAGFILGNNPGWSNTTLPLFGGVDGNFIRVLIAYGILLGTPGIPAAVKGALGVKDQNPITQAALGGAAAGFGTLSNAANKGWQTTGLPQQRAEYMGAQNKARATGSTPPIPTIGTTGWRNRVQRFIVTGRS